MHVVEEDDQWTLAGKLLEHAADRPERLLRGRGTGGLADRGADQLRDSDPVLHAGQQLGQPLLATGFEDDVPHRPEGDRLPVGQAATAERPEPSLELLQQLGDRGATSRSRPAP